MSEGEFCTICKDYKYNRNKTNYFVESDFILVKQLDYEDKKFDWIFATNLKFKSAEKYVKLQEKDGE